MPKNPFLLLLIFCLITSCKLRKLYDETTIDLENFSSTIQFQRLSSGHIVVPVIIKNKEYSFLVDTGTPNIISKKLAETLKLEHVSHHKYMDSQDNTLKLSLAEIDQIKIGGITFNKNATIIHDFEKSPPTIRCLNIAGVIGANLMKRAIWQFDFERNEIVISDSKEYTNNSNTNILKFGTGYSGTPIVKVDINGISDGKAYVDFGAKGFYKSSKRTFKKLCKESVKDQCKTTSGYGSMASGAFGYEEPDSSYIALVHGFSIGSNDPAKLTHQLITLSNHSDKLIGLEFFENYLTTINWKDKELALTKRTNQNKILTYDSFGFKVVFIDNKLHIGFIYQNSPASKSGLEIGDQITKINQFDFDQSTEDQFCRFQNSNILDTEDELNLSITRDGKVLDFNLKQIDLFGAKAMSISKD
ncbi:MAG: hypothetical protein ACJA2S_001820 [Cyclobacteriaceae bacterium]|jgi:hypothetical protein